MIKWWTVPRLSASENGYEMGNLGERAQLSLLRVLYAPYNKRVRRTRSSEWSWSFNCPLPSSLNWEQGRRTSPDSAISQGSGYPVPFKNQEVKSNDRFREAVQFVWVSQRLTYCLNIRYIAELNRFAEPNIRLDFLIIEWYWISTALRYCRVRGSSPALLPI